MMNNENIEVIYICGNDYRLFVCNILFWMSDKEYMETVVLSFTCYWREALLNFTEMKV